MSSGELKLEEIKRIALDILVYVDSVCQKNHLRYSIYYGTLLGAVRHQGFIPWDDDIDIVMPRNDYQSLLNILKKDSHYLLLDNQTRPNYRYTFAKVVDTTTKGKSSQFFGSEDLDYGVFIDIFPMDGVPEEKVERDNFWRECETYRENMLDTMGLAYARANSLVKSIGKLILRYPHHRKLSREGDYYYWRDKYEQSASRYNFDDSKYCGFMETVNNKWGVFPVAWFEEFENINFEGIQVRTIKAKEEFLSTRYGEYMQLPPEEEQITHHPYKFFYKDR